MESLTLTTDMIVVLALLAFTVFLFVTEVVRVDVAAVFVMVLLGLLSLRLNIPLSRLLMPMGFAAIVGGTITMVGSSPLILLNDLLPEGMEPFGLFDVTPIGLALLAGAIVYFVVLGPFVLPSAATTGGSGESTADYFRRVYGLNYEIREVRVGNDSSLVGGTVAEVETRYGIVIIGNSINNDLRIGPWSGYEIESGSYLAVLGSPEALGAFVESTGVRPRRDLKVFRNAMAPTKSGIAELVIRPGSRLIGKTVTEVAMRRTYGLSVLRLQRGEELTREGLRDVPLQASDTLVVHCDWESLARLEGDRDFVIVTSDYPREQLRPSKVPHALFFLAVALGMILLTELPLSVALLTGALGMILTGVIEIDDAYRAVSWKTVFLLASLIPLGAAVENTGTAAWIAQNTLDILGQVRPWVLQATIFALATFFTLVMSNVGATVLLVPLSINFAIAAQLAGMDADPRVFALTVAIATSNSFLIPTHQVNALIMGPGGYRVKDYLKAGSIMTILFMVVALIMLNIIF
ncbi:MAG: SLC13 family permease [Thioalkalivibrio sp.]|nr:SLC13 family permease [Thioalkalivibrio sp.]